MRFDIKTLPVLLLLLPAAAAQAKDYRAAVGAKDGEFVAAYAAGNAAKPVSLFQAGAVVLPPDTSEPRRQGAIQALWHSWIGGTITNLGIQTQSVERAGKLAYEIGDFTADAPDGNGSTIEVTGNFVIILKKRRLARVKASHRHME